MLNKYREVFLLLFSSISVVNCEYKNSVTFDFGVDSYKQITCAVKPDHVVLVQGEKLEILADNVMSKVYYMWCKDQYNSAEVDRCSYDVEAKQCSVVVDDLKASESNWTCEFYLQRDDNDDSINSTRFNYGTEFNYATCNLRIDIKGSLWFTGLDPERRSITHNQDQMIYRYRFKRGEKLNISCEQEGSETKIFKVHDRRGNVTFIGSRFERQATSDLSWKYLTCFFTGIAKSSQTNTVLYLDEYSPRDPLWFTGLDYSRVTTTKIDGTTNYTYKYILNEDIKIGCDADMNDILELSLIFIDAVSPSTINSIKYPSLFEFSSANSTLNSSSLLCVLRKYSKIVYTVKLYFVLDLSLCCDGLCCVASQAIPICVRKREVAGRGSVELPCQNGSVRDTDAQGHKTEPVTDEGPKVNWKIVLIAATVVTLCVIVLSVVLICRRKKILVVKELTPKYFTLKGRTRVPPENANLGIKDHNNAGEALYSYVDLNRRRLDFGPEETYVEPIYTKTELYAPSPAQRGSKTPNELNYTNVFKQGYVNSKK